MRRIARTSPPFYTDRALRVDDEEFEALVDDLEELDWIRRLEAARPGGIRNHPDGGVDELDPDCAERNRDAD